MLILQIEESHGGERICCLFTREPAVSSLYTSMSQYIAWCRDMFGEEREFPAPLLDTDFANPGYCEVAFGTWSCAGGWLEPEATYTQCSICPADTSVIVE